MWYWSMTWVSLTQGYTEGFLGYETENDLGIFGGHEFSPLYFWEVESLR